MLRSRPELLPNRAHTRHPIRALGLIALSGAGGAVSALAGEASPGTANEPANEPCATLPADPCADGTENTGGTPPDETGPGGPPPTSETDPRNDFPKPVSTAGLLLPAELRPHRLISRLALGSPSFTQPDHYDHIHVEF